MIKDRKKKELERILSTLTGRSLSGVDFSGLTREEVSFVLNGYISEILSSEGELTGWKCRRVLEVAKKAKRSFTPEEYFMMATRIARYVEKYPGATTDEDENLEIAQELLQGLESKLQSSGVDLMGEVYLDRAIKSFKMGNLINKRLRETTFSPHADLLKAQGFFKQTGNTTQLREVGRYALRGANYLIGKTLLHDILTPLELSYDLVVESYEVGAEPEDNLDLVKDMLRTHPKISVWRRLSGVPDIEPTTYISYTNKDVAENQGDETGIPPRNEEFYHCNKEEETFGLGRVKSSKYIHTYTLKRKEFMSYLDRIEEIRTARGLIILDRITDPELLSSAIDFFERDRSFKGDVDLAQIKQTYFERTGEIGFGKFIGQFVH